jgi:hypothetical protein
MSEEAGIAGTLWIYFRETHGSNLGVNTCYAEVFYGFPQENSGM